MFEIRRREFITFLGGAAAVWPLAARGQQGDRVRRIGVFFSFDENDLETKRSYSVFTQALASLGWTDGRNVRMDVRGVAVIPIGYRCLRRSWSACNPTST